MAHKKIVKNLSVLFSIVIAILVFGFFTSRTSPDEIAAVEIKPPLEISLIDNMPLPHVDWKTIDGQDFELSDNQFTIVNFWASWCAPCVVEFPELIDFVNQHKNFNLVFVSNDLNEQDMNLFLENLPAESKEILKDNARISLLFDKGGKITRDVFQTYKLPESYLLNRDKNIIAKINGVVSQNGYDYLGNL